MIAFLLLAAAAVPHQDLAALDRAVAAFTGHAVGAEGGARAAIDARLRLRPCSTVALSWRSDAHDAVVVACSGPDWRIFVPVRGATPVASTAPAPAARIAVPARAEPVIRRGDPVVIEAAANGFSISREGVAITDAPAGGRFTIRVEGAKAPVQALAIAGGRATLPGWGE